MTQTRFAGVKNLARWDRTDQVGLETLLYGVVGLGVLSLVPEVLGAVRGAPIRVESELPDSAVSAAGVEGPFSGVVVLEDPSAAQQLLGLLPSLLLFLVVGGCAALLLGVTRALRHGDPFTPASARRLTWLALLLAVGGIAVQLVEDLTRNALVSDAGALGAAAPTVFTLSVWPVAAALLVAFVAEVFARGSALRDEVEGLV